jgi:hypothetical protein
MNTDSHSSVALAEGVSEGSVGCRYHSNTLTNVRPDEEDFVAWDIDIDDFTNVIQTNITKISIGMAGSSSDTVYL